MSASVAPDSTKQKTPSVQVTGDVSLSTGFYALRGLEATRPLLNPWGLSGEFSLSSRSGWVVPVQLLWSSETQRFRQPYNQVGASPRFREWLVLHGGYRNVVFSPLTLAGHTFLGGGIELNPGVLRVGAVVGKFNRAVNANFADPDRVATFGRSGYSAKVGLGNQRSYLDLIVLRVADDAQSIRVDSLPQLAPAENVVLGLSGRFQFSKKLSVEIDAAASAYTHDSRTDTVATLTSHDERFRYLGQLKNLFTARESTQIYTALQAQLNYRGRWADLKLRYKRTEPGYTSMGAYFFQTDLESFTAAPALKLFHKRLNLRGSVGWQHDNLLNQKKTRTDRLIGSLSVSYASKKDLTIDLSYSNYGITQRAGYRPINDTMRVAQNNRTLTGSVFKLWAGQTTVHTVTGSATYQELQDLNPFTADLNRSNNLNYTLNYMLEHLVANFDLNLGYGYTHTTGFDMSSAFYGPSLEIGHRTLRNKLAIRLTVNYLESLETLTDLSESGSVVSTGLNLSYQLTPVHRLSLNATNVQSRGLQSFCEQQGSVQYSMSF
ncbi:MAG: hypothetical protein EAZ91_09355 [Cytophagales bacterium]|nr:MAG: hypothetical protein EAZ91_09355 [Cytophagales bacterium]